MIWKEALALAAIALVMLVAGCGDDLPKPEKVDASSNRDYQVSRLFVDDQGCIVHRFRDDYYYHYYVTCPDSRQASTQTDYDYRVGKVTHHRRDSIPTLYK